MEKISENCKSKVNFKLDPLVLDTRNSKYSERWSRISIIKIFLPNGKIYTVGGIIINNSVGNCLMNDGPHFYLHIIVGTEFVIGTSKDNFEGN